MRSYIARCPCFTTCLCVYQSGLHDVFLDLDDYRYRYRAAKMMHLSTSSFLTTRFTICFTICLCTSPDRNVYKNHGQKRVLGTKNETLFQGTQDTICFTICLFISPDLDGHRAPKSESLTPRVSRHVSLKAETGGNLILKSSFRIAKIRDQSLVSKPASSRPREKWLLMEEQVCLWTTRRAKYRSSRLYCGTLLSQR